MEWLWTVAGLVAGGVLTLGLTRRNALAGLPRARGKPVGDDDEMVRRYKALAAEVEDVLERERRMYDRLRKRARVDAEDAPVPREDVPNGLTRMTPGQIMAFGRERGIVR